MPGAAERIAAKLAAKSEAKPADVEADEPEDESEPDTDNEPIVEASANGASEKPLTRKEQAAARKASAVAQTAIDEGTVAGTVIPKKAIASKPATASKGKKPASPAQLAAREAFAARSRAASAAKRGEPVVTPPTKAVVSGKGRQTPEQVREAQSAERKVAREAAAAAAQPKRASTSKAVKAKETSAQRRTRIAREKEEAKPKLKVLTGGKGTKPTPAAKATAAKAKSERHAGETKSKVHALLAKGKTRQEIMAALNLSYASVFFHAKSYEGDVTSVRGKIFVKSPLDADGQKLGKGKSVEVSRSEAMRRQFLSGVEVKQIAKNFDVMYQIAYTACRPLFASDDE